MNVGISVHYSKRVRSCRITMESPALSTAMSVYMTVALVLAMTCNCYAKPANIASKVPALFVFGDSLLDTGNNNGLLTLARAATPPYGEDLSRGKYGSSSSGGRFSNGLITTDFIAASLKLPCPPTYVSAGDNIERGVNFASAATGILDVTGDNFGEHYSLGQQIENFRDVKDRLEQKVGTEASSLIISKSIFYITTASNDYFITYYSKPPNPVYGLLPPAQFRDLLISNLKEYLQNLYHMGARKFAVTAIPPIGCTPFAFWRYSKKARDNDGCILFMNKDAQAYNRQLFSSIQTLRDQFSDAHFIYNNAYDAARRIYENPTAYGITNEHDACCDLQGDSMPGVLCITRSHICANASQYFFFDGFHPTTTVHQLTALTYIKGSFPYVSPVNLQTLASLT